MLLDGASFQGEVFSFKHPPTSREQEHERQDKTITGQYRTGQNTAEQYRAAYRTPVHPQARIDSPTFCTKHNPTQQARPDTHNRQQARPDRQTADQAGRQAIDNMTETILRKWRKKEHRKIALELIELCAGRTDGRGRLCVSSLPQFLSRRRKQE